MSETLNKRVLLVEDDENFSDFIKVFFEDLEIEFDLTQEPEEAMKLLSENNYKLIMLDVSLGNFDGTECASMISKKCGTADIVMCTAKDNRWLSNNMNVKYRHLKKPFKVDELIKILGENKLI